MNKKNGYSKIFADPVDWKGTAVFILKFIFAIIVLWLLFRLDYIQVELFSQLYKNIHLVPVITFLLGIAFPICALRWHYLLKTQGIKFSYILIFKVNYISTFLGLFLPGAIGGDAIRIALGSKLLPQQKIVLALSVFFDRLIGGLGILSWVIMAFIIFLSINIDHYGTNILIFSVGAVIVVSILSIFSIKYFSFQLHKFTNKHSWQKGNFIQRIIANIADSIMLYRNCPVQLAFCYALSLIVHASRLTVIYILAVAMGMGGVDVITYILAGSVSFFANFIPITPGGIGIAEVAFAQIIGLLKANGRQTAYGTVILAIRAFDAAILLPSLLIRYDKLRSKMRWFRRT